MIKNVLFNVNSVIHFMGPLIRGFKTKIETKVDLHTMCYVALGRMFSVLFHLTYDAYDIYYTCDTK